MNAPRPNRLSRLPPALSHWLGYRPTQPKPVSKYVVWLWSFIGAFCGLSVLQAVFGHAHYFIERGVPSIIASYGASAVLCYGAIEAPLAQPRALIGGHFIAALIGLCITKLFSLSSHFQSLRWLAASLSTSLSLVVMQMTATTHPPAGATAILVATNDEVLALSWYYIPVILLSSVLVLVVALIVDNIQRRYPVYWIEHAPHTPPAPVKHDPEEVIVSSNGPSKATPENGNTDAQTLKEKQSTPRRSEDSGTGRSYLDGGGDEANEEELELDSERIV